MKTKQLFLFVSFLLFISCEENSQILGAYQGEPDQYSRVYLKYYLLQDSPPGFSETDYVITANIWDSEYDLLVTSPRSGGKIIKNYSEPIGFHQIDDQGYDLGAIGGYYIVNINVLYSFLYNVVYDTYYEEDKDEVVEAAVAHLNDWLVDDPNQNANPNQYKERVFFFGEDVIFTENLDGEEYNVISKAFYLPYTKTGNTKYVIEQPSIYVYEYDSVLNEENPAKFSKFDIKITYDEMKYIPDF
jgi:hypothetical protein